MIVKAYQLEMLIWPHSVTRWPRLPSSSSTLLSSLVILFCMSLALHVSHKEAGFLHHRPKKKESSEKNPAGQIDLTLQLPLLLFYLRFQRPSSFHRLEVLTVCFLNDFIDWQSRFGYI